MFTCAKKRSQQRWPVLRGGPVLQAMSPRVDPPCVRQHAVKNKGA